MNETSCFSFNSCSAIVLAILILLLCLTCDEEIGCIQIILALLFASTLTECFACGDNNNNNNNNIAIA